MVAPSAGIAVIRRGRSADNRMDTRVQYISLDQCAGFAVFSARLMTLLRSLPKVVSSMTGEILL